MHLGQIPERGEWNSLQCNIKAHPYQLRHLFFDWIIFDTSFHHLHLTLLILLSLFQACLLPTRKLQEPWSGPAVQLMHLIFELLFRIHTPWKPSWVLDWKDRHLFLGMRRKKVIIAELAWAFRAEWHGSRYRLICLFCWQFKEVIFSSYWTWLCHDEGDYSLSHSRVFWRPGQEGF